LNTIINRIGYNLKKVQKTKPIKKIAETDLIFNNLNLIHETTAKTDRILRLSIDAKDRVKIGEFSRSGKGRVAKEAYDHDFGDKYVTPFGIMNINDQTISVSLAESKITADYIADRLEEYWDRNKYQDKIDVILINSDNGSEGSSKRTQFIKRMVEFTARIGKKIILAYYPPYHSKYNPIERFWGRLEQHWNADLLDCKEVVGEFIKTATWEDNIPDVEFINKVYNTGIKIKAKIMKIYESALKRKNKIEKWFVILEPDRCKKVVDSLQM
jgi:hypothetical protein